MMMKSRVFMKACRQRCAVCANKRGISQLELALEIGIKSVAFYSNCECNRYGKHFNLEHIYKLAKALNVPLSELFAGDEFSKITQSNFE